MEIMARHDRTLARILCYGEEENVMVRQLNFFYISIKKFLKASLELQIHYFKSEICHNREIVF